MSSVRFAEASTRSILSGDTMKTSVEVQASCVTADPWGALENVSSAVTFRFPLVSIVPANKLYGSSVGTPAPPIVSPLCVRPMTRSPPWTVQ